MEAIHTMTTQKSQLTNLEYIIATISILVQFKSLVMH